MIKFKKVKQAKVKRIEDEKFKIVKKNSEEEHEDSEKNEENFQQENGNFSPSSRTAPILSSDNSQSQQLENIAESAPRRAKNGDVGNANQNYSANYSTNYSNASYDSAREEENWRTARIRAQRQEGTGIGLRQTNMTQTQGNWNSQSNIPGQMQEQTRPVDVKYAPAEDRMKADETARMSRRRRMM